MNEQTTDKTYNGWTNYQTWSAKMWLTKEQRTRRYWCGRAAREWRYALEDPPHTRETVAIFNLSDQLREAMTECSPLQEPSVYFDLLNEAMSEINWDEIARWMISAVDKTEDTDDEDEEDDNEGGD